MALRGDLASVDLAQVFQMLALNKKTGLLSIQSPRLWKVLYFDARGVTLYYNPHVLLDRALASFVRAGRIQGTVLDDVRDHAGRNHLELFDSLLAGGYLEEEELTAQIRYEVEEEIYELFFCKDARFEFLEGQQTMQEREGVVDPRFFFNTESVIMEAARRIDEWSYIAERIPNGLEVFAKIGGAPDPEEVGPECPIVFEAVDGRRTVARIVEVTGLSSFAVFKGLSQLLDGGTIAPLAPDQLLAAGQTCLREGRPHDAINLFEKAIELGVGVPDVHSLAAQAYESTTEYENAIYHLKCDAEYRIAAGDLRGAAQRLRAAGAMVPTDLAARERLVELALGHTEVRLPDFDPVEEGKVLVDLFMGAGDQARVRSLLERLLGERPDDIELKKLLVNVHAKAGDQARVIDLYESIAKTLVRQHRPLEAVAYLQKILMLDRSRVDISDRVRALYTQDERSRSRRRAMATLGGVCLLLIASAVAYSFYDQAANDAFGRLDVAREIEAQQIDTAREIYDRFVAQYPLTSAATRARGELARLDGLRLEQVAAQRNRDAARERELLQVRSEYKADWRRHREVFLAGQPEAALTIIQSVQARVAAAGAEEDLAWALEEQVEKTATKLAAFVAKSQELERRRSEELAAGRVDNAWVIAVELLTTYDITAAARRSRIPVRINTRPAGARLLRNGAPVVETVDGKEQPVLTPVVVMCGAEPENFAAALPGFETVTFDVKPKERAVVEVPLKIIPVRRIDLTANASSPVGGSGDWVVVGMRNGHVAVASARSGQLVRRIELPGLQAIDGAPVVVGDRAWFFTNEGTLEGWNLTDGRCAAGWPVSATGQTELTAREGRLLFVDRENTLHCLDQGDGRAFWSLPLGAPPVGPVTIERRTVRVAVADGRIVAVDAIDGSVGSTLRCPAGITTRVAAADGRVWFGGADGRVRCVDEASGRVLWGTDLGRPLADGELVLTATAVVVLGSDHRLVQLDRQTGERRASMELPAAELQWLQLRGEQLLTVMRHARDGQRLAHDLVQARLADTLTLLWEYEDEGLLTGAPNIDGAFAAVAGADGDVVLLR